MMTNLLAELIGTFILIYFGAGVVASVLLKDTKAQGSGWLVICIAWATAVTVAIYAVGRISGAHINPAVTIALAVAGEFPWKDVFPYIVGQFIGASLGAAATYIHYLPHWERTESKEDKLAVFSTAPAIENKFSNLLSEILGTWMLLFLIMSIGANNFSKGINPMLIGLIILLIGLGIGSTTGYAINPARDLGPRIMHSILPIKGKGDSDWKYAWIPVVGPLLGGCLGSLSYLALFENKCILALVICLALTLAILRATILLKNKAS